MRARTADGLLRANAFLTTQTVNCYSIQPYHCLLNLNLVVSSASHTCITITALQLTSLHGTSTFPAVYLDTFISRSRLPINLSTAFNTGNKNTDENCLPSHA